MAVYKTRFSIIHRGFFFSFLSSFTFLFVFKEDNRAAWECKLLHSSGKYLAMCIIVFILRQGSSVISYLRNTLEIRD